MSDSGKNPTPCLAQLRVNISETKQFFSIPTQPHGFLGPKWVLGDIQLKIKYLLKDWFFGLLCACFGFLISNCLCKNFQEKDLTESQVSKENVNSKWPFFQDDPTSNLSQIL